MNFERPGFNESRETIDFILGERLLMRRPSMDEFEGVYSSTRIADDKRNLEVVKRKFTEPLEHLTPDERERIEARKRRSEALEIVIANQGELSNWFGENALLQRTSEYDDVMNNIDVIVEIDEGNEGEAIALAVDASMRAETDTIQEKFLRNLGKVVGDEELAHVKYFHSQITGKRGELKNVIPAVVGIDGEHCEDLMALFAQVTRLSRTRANTASGSERVQKLQQETLREKRALLENHPAQAVFLEEIAAQLTAYLAILDRGDATKKTISRSKIARVLKVIEGIRASKASITTTELQGDGVFASIQAVASRYTSSRKKK